MCKEGSSTELALLRLRLEYPVQRLGRIRSLSVKVDFTGHTQTDGKNISINNGNLQTGKERRKLLENLLEFCLRILPLCILACDLVMCVLAVIKLFFFFESQDLLSLNYCCLILSPPPLGLGLFHQRS